MKGDYTRENNNLGKGYSAVRMQQGRVQLDSDWNEQIDIENKRLRQIINDVIGVPGVPIIADWRSGRKGIPQLVLFDTRSPVYMFPSISGRDSLLGIRCYAEGIILEHEFPFLSATIDAVAAGTADYTVNVPTMEFPNGRPIVAGMRVYLVADGDESPDSNIATVYDDVKTVDVVGKKFTIKKKSSSTVLTTPIPARVVFLYSYEDQPYYPNPPALTPAARYLAYLDVWQRQVTAVEDPDLRDVALGGVDTTTRLQPRWQLKMLPFADADLPTLDDGTWIDKLRGSTPAGMAARYSPAPGQAQALENRLYRVEIHKGGVGSAVTFKWSRDNGSALAAWTGGDGPIEIAATGQVEALGFAKGQWLELGSDELEYKSQPGPFVQISDIPTPIDGGLSLKIAAPVGTDTTFSHYKGHPRVRRWDGGGVTYPLSIVPTTPGSFISLENGIEVQFDQTATYVEGDYWLIPSRTSLGGIEWPHASGTPVAQTAKRIEHKYVPLISFKLGGGGDVKIGPSYFTSLRNMIVILTKKEQKYLPIMPVFSKVVSPSGTVGDWSINWSVGSEIYAQSNTSYLTVGVIPLKLPEKSVITRLMVTWNLGGSPDVHVHIMEQNPGSAPIPVATIVRTTATTGVSETDMATVRYDTSTQSYYYIQATAGTFGTAQIFAIYVEYSAAILNGFD